jgi:hypothetical protein
MSLADLSATTAARRAPAERGRARPRHDIEEIEMARLQTDDRDDLTGENFAFPHQRKEPLEDASHVRNAIARFDQVDGRDRCRARCRVEAHLSAAKKFGVEVRREELARAAEAQALKRSAGRARTDAFDAEPDSAAGASRALARRIRYPRRLDHFD